MKNKLLITVFLFVLKAEAQTSAFVAIDSVLNSGNYKKALVLLQKVNPPNFESNKKTAQIYEAIDEYQKAISFYNKSLKIKESLNVKISLGKLYRKLGNIRKTILLYEEVLAENPENLLLQYQLGKLYLVRRQGTKAIALFKDLVTKDATNANYSYQLGRAYAIKKKGDLMINTFLEAHQKDNKHIKSLFQLSNAFYSINKRDSAFLFINKGLEVDKNHVNLNKLKANLYFKKKQYNKAITVLKHLDTIEKNDTFTKNMLAKSYNNLKDYKLAKKYFEQSVKIDPSDYKMFTYIGNLESELGNTRAAQMNYFKAIAYGKVSLDEEYLGLAILDLKKEKRKEALRLLNKAYQENSMSYKVTYQLALLEDSMSKDKKKAYKLYKRYMNYHEGKDAKQTAFIKARIKEINRDYFFRGEKLE